MLLDCIISCQISAVASGVDVTVECSTLLIVLKRTLGLWLCLVILLAIHMEKYIPNVFIKYIFAMYENGQKCIC